MNGDQLVHLIADMQAAYPRSEWPEATIRIYAQMLSDLDHVAARTALVSWVATEKWPPTIAELRERAVQPLQVRTAEEAWEHVVVGYSPYGSVKSLCGGDEAAERAFLSVFGPNRFGDDAWLPKFDQWTRKTFIEAYNAVAGRLRKEQASGALVAETREMLEALAEKMQLPKGEQ